MPTRDAILPHAAPRTGGNLVNHGGPVQTTPQVYLVFWGWTPVTTAPTGGLVCLVNVDTYCEAPYLISFLQGVGGSSWAGVDTQYSGITNPAGQLKGWWMDDPSPYDPTVEDASFYPQNIEAEAQRAVAHFGYSANADYVIALPPGANLHGRQADGYCAWHWDNVNDPAGHPIAYTNLPYVPDMGLSCGLGYVNKPGLLDGVSIVAGHEYAEAVTDPQLNAWYDSAGQENGDKCAWNSGPGAHAQNVVLSTGTFAVQSLWSNAASACAVSYP